MSCTSARADAHAIDPLEAQARGRSRRRSPRRRAAARSRARTSRCHSSCPLPDRSLVRKRATSARGTTRSSSEREARVRDAPVDHHHDGVGDAAHLRQVVRDPDDRDRRRQRGRGRAARALLAACGSSDDVGSSMSSTSGSVTSVRARHTRCASPPESSDAGRCRNSPSSRARASAATRVRPRRGRARRRAGSRAPSPGTASAAGRPCRPAAAGGAGRGRRRRRRGSGPSPTSAPRAGCRCAAGVDFPAPDGPITTVTPVVRDRSGDVLHERAVRPVRRSTCSKVKSGRGDALSLAP